MRRNLRDPAKEQHWREILARYSSSGMSTKRFALQEGINHHSLSSWKYIIRDRDKEARRQAQLTRNERQRQIRKKKANRLFVPMVLSEKTQPTDKNQSNVVAEITFSGHCVRIFNGIDAATLSMLMQALKEDTRAGNDQQHKNISLHGTHGYAQEF
jgi:hypothetical protein